MKAWLYKKGTRIVCFALCLVFTVLGAVACCGARQCWTRGWYAGSPFANNGESFADSGFAKDYVNGCLYYVYSYIQWKGTITEDVVSGYSGKAFSIYITDKKTGEVVLDTRTDKSVPVDMEVTAQLPDNREPEELPLSDGAVIDVEPEDATLWNLEGYVNLPVEPYDGCYAEYWMHETLHLLRPWFIPAAVVFLLLAAALAALMIWSAAVYTPAKRNFFDRVPLEVFALVLAALAAIAIGGLVNLSTWLVELHCSYFVASYLQGYFTYSCVRTLCWTAAGLLVVWSFLRRWKCHELRRSVLVLRLPAMWRLAALTALAAVFALGWIYAWAHRGWNLTTPVLVLVLTVLATAHAVVLAVQFGRLEKAARELAAGRLDYQVATHGLMTGLREQGEALNSIGAGLKRAVDEQMKGERFKTELITNVSHDLKTPLTSIVSYVDLLKKEDVPSPTAREYIEVIDRQSAKLKKLTEDLVEASRASSGAIAVHPEPTDVRELLSQSVGEYTERLAASGIEVVMALPPRGVVLDTDGRLLWRVLENLLQNIVKYAQPGTRAYFDLLCEGERVTLALKNTSAEALNIPAEELMERFVRGDVSRHTEGSGLGLSIAQSLTELLGGTMALYLDGDLFKVTLAFEGAREQC